MTYRITYGQYGDEQDVLNPEAGVFLKSASAKFEVNVSPTLTFEMPPSHPLWGKMVSMSADKEIRLYEDDEELLRGRITTNQDDLDRFGVVEVEDQQAYLNDIRVRPYTTYYADDQGDELPIVSGNLAQWIIEGYNAKCTPGHEIAFLSSEVGDDLIVSNTDEPTVRDELNDKIYSLGAYAIVRSMGQRRTIMFRKSVDQGGQTIRLGENLLSYTHKRDYTGVKTAIIASGKWESDENTGQDGEEFGLETLNNGDYGAIRIDGDRAIHVEMEKAHGILEDKRSYEAHTPGELLELVERDLEASVIDVESIEVTAYDLHQANPSIEPLRLCKAYEIDGKSQGISKTMMLTSMDIDVCNPDASVYHFGRLAESLSRSEASGASRNRTDLSDVKKKQNTTNSKVRGLIDGLDEIGDGLLDLGALYEGFDEKLDGMDDAIKVAAEKMQNTAFGLCTSAADAQEKEVTVAYPNGGEFHLEQGTIVSVQFQYGNSAESPTLNVSGTGPHPITTNGSMEAWWQDGQTVLFTYMDGNWCTMSAPVWTSSAIIGDPRDYNIKLMPKSFSMCVGDNQYINADDDGFQVGYTAVVDGSGMAAGKRNIHIGSNEIAMRQGQIDYLTIDDTGIQVGMDEYNHLFVGDSSITFSDPDYPAYDLIVDSQTIDGEVWRNISCGSKLTLRAGTAGAREYPAIQIDSGNSGRVIRLIAYDEIQVDTQSVLLGDMGPNSGEIHFFAQDFRYTSRGPHNSVINAALDIPALANAVRTTIVRQVNNSDHVQISPSELGVSNLDRYAFFASNGDFSANQFNVRACTPNGDLYVFFDGTVSGSVRLNIFGVQCDRTVTDASDPGESEGPSI